MATGRTENGDRDGVKPIKREKEIMGKHKQRMSNIMAFIMEWGELMSAEALSGNASDRR